MPFETWIAFVLTSVVILLIPGPTILTVVTHSLLHGRRAYTPLVAAVMLGDATAITLSLLGLGTLLASSAKWFEILRWVGGIYLIYLGLRFLLSGARRNGPQAPSERFSNWPLFRSTYVVAVMNPKGIVFYVAFFPQFVTTEAPVAGQLMSLAITFLCLGFLNVTAYSWFAATSGGFLMQAKAQQRIRLAAGSLLSAAGAYALLSR